MKVIIKVGSKERPLTENVIINVLKRENIGALVEEMIQIAPTGKVITRGFTNQKGELVLRIKVKRKQKEVND